jgi:hypothetical protein
MRGDRPGPIDDKIYQRLSGDRDHDEPADKTGAAA